MPQVDIDGLNSTLKADVIRGQASTSTKLGGDLDLDGNDITGTGGIPAANLTGTLPAINGSSLTGISTQKNVIINGDFNIWQRGVTHTAHVNGEYTADRWGMSNTGTVGVFTVAKALASASAANVPTAAESGHLSAASLKVDVTTLDSSVDAADNVSLWYKVEGYDFAPLAQKAFTLSFWHKHTVTGTHSVAFRNSGNDRNYTAEYTQSVSNTWEKATINVSASPDPLSAGTWNLANGNGLQILFFIMMGSNGTAATLDSWTSTSVKCSDNQVNNTSSTSNSFMLAQVQLETGSTATDFEIRNHTTELAMCKRYYQKSYPYGTDPGTVNSIGCGIFGINGIASAAHYVEIQCNLHTTMRTTPTATVYSTISPADSGKMNINGTNVTGAAINVGEHAFGAYGYSPTATSIDAEVHWTASAEL